MSKPQTITCPNCGASFQVSVEQLTRARGRVRCGSCLRIFDGIREELDFIPPPLPGEDTPHPIVDLEVKPMAAADLPPDNRATSWSAWTILVALLLLLLAQFYLPGLLGNQEQQKLELANVVVRPHPDVEGALRMDAVIRNAGNEAAPLPLLVLGFTNRQGEPRARREFFPAEYLHGNQPLRLPPRSEIQVSLSLADPGPDAVNYLAHIKPVAARAN